jgi:hypothetical protein
VDAALLHASKGDEHAGEQAEHKTDGNHAGNLADDLARRGERSAMIQAQRIIGLVRVGQAKRIVSDVAHGGRSIGCDDTTTK